MERVMRLGRSMARQHCLVCRRVCFVCSTPHLFSKGAYFLYFLMSGFLSPFLSIILRDKGVSGAWIGTLLAIYPLVGFVSSAWWTAVADAFSAHKLIMVCTMTGAMFSVYGLWLAVGLMPLAIALSLFAMFVTSISPLLDNRVLFVLPDKRQYGTQRLFGALGWGLSAPLVGVLVDAADDTYPMFLCYMAAACVFQLFLITQLVSDPVERDAEQEWSEVGSEKLLSPSASTESSQGNGGERGGSEELQKQEGVEDAVEERISANGARVDVPHASAQLPFWRRYYTLMSNRRVLSFLVVTSALGMGASIIGTYLFLFLAEDLDASDLLLGLTISFTVVMEFPLFFWSQTLLRKWGVKGMIVVAHAAFITRVLAYSVLPNAWLVLPVEMLHGVTFACTWTAGVVYMDAIAPPDLKASVQGVFSATFSGLGRVAGSVVGGIIFEHLGARVLFALCAAGGLLSCAFFWMTHVDVDLSTEPCPTEVELDSLAAELDSLAEEDDSVP